MTFFLAARGPIGSMGAMAWTLAMEIVIPTRRAGDAKRLSVSLKTVCDPKADRWKRDVGAQRRADITPNNRIQATGNKFPAPDAERSALENYTHLGEA